MMVMKMTGVETKALPFPSVPVIGITEKIMQSLPKGAFP